MTDDQSDLGTDMIKQLLASPRALWISAIVVVGIGLVPGFPKPVFFGIAAALGAVAFSLSRRAWFPQPAAAAPQAPSGVQPQPGAPAQTEPAGSAQPVGDIASLPGDMATIRVGSGLLPEIIPDAFVADRAQAAEAFMAQVGIEAPRFGVLEDKSLGVRAFEIDLDGVPVFSGQIPPQSILLETEQEIADLASIQVTAAGADWPIALAFWAAAPMLPKAQAAGIVARTPGQLLIAAALHFIKQNIGRVIGFRDMQRLVGDLQTAAPEIAEHISQTVSPARLLDILRRLLDEGVALSSRRILFEAIAELASQEVDPALLVEQIRRAMRRQICNGVADRNRVIAAYVIEPDLEQILRASLRQTETGSYLILSNATSARLLGQLDRIKAPLQAGVQKPVIVTSSDVRRHLRNYLVEHGLFLAVLSFQEIAPEFYLQPVGTLSASDTPFDNEMDFAN
jgi:type III secretion protein V